MLNITENQVFFVSIPLVWVPQLGVVCNKSCFSSAVGKWCRDSLCSSVHLVVLSMRGRAEAGTLTSAYKRICSILPDLVFHFCCSVGHKKLKHFIRFVLFSIGSWGWFSITRRWSFFEETLACFKLSGVSRKSCHRLLPECPHRCTYILGECHGKASIHSVLNLLLDASKFIYFCFSCVFVLQVFYRETLDKIGIG